MKPTSVSKDKYLLMLGRGPSLVQLPVACALSGKPKFASANTFQIKCEIALNTHAHLSLHDYNVVIICMCEWVITSLMTPLELPDHCKSLAVQCFPIVSPLAA